MGAGERESQRPARGCQPQVTHGTGLSPEQDGTRMQAWSGSQTAGRGEAGDQVLSQGVTASFLERVDRFTERTKGQSRTQDDVRENILGSCWAGEGLCLVSLKSSKKSGCSRETENYTEMSQS